MNRDRLPLTKPHRAVRWASAILLVTCLGMIALGNTVWKDQLQGPRFALFWSWCFLLAAVAIVTALVDLVLLGRAYRRQRRELFRREFMSAEFHDQVRRARSSKSPREE
ncbi:MAG: hypothetical protein NZ483_11635 [Verrucomicrobiae bacterium]|nr:hypothetical protein [Verrucomicrobiae bacterium]MDW8345115.1 hypothetical protein [Verrucomicrobiae bacterium]